MKKGLLPKLLLLAVALVLFSTSLLVVLSPKFRGLLDSLTQNNSRTVISQLTTDLSMPNKSFKILKIFSKNHLWIEVYDLKLSEDRIAIFKLPSRHDGQIFINKKSSSLIASDIDGDQILEIISPSFSSELQPKVHAFKYNPITDSFSEVSNEVLLRSINL